MAWKYSWSIWRRTFVYSEGHPALTDKSHEKFNKVKLGDKGIAEKAGVWVEGFLEIPETLQEMEVEAYANARARFANMFGLSQIATQEATVDDYDEPTEEETISQEAIGIGKQPK